jgi:phosphoglycerate dehydrogenase-like enzyme
MPNVTSTSHYAGLNRPERMVAFFLDNLRRFRDGRPLSGVVDPAPGY